MQTISGPTFLGLIAIGIFGLTFLCWKYNYTTAVVEQYTQYTHPCTNTYNDLLPASNKMSEKHQCQQSRSHGWCVDRQGNGKCVEGFLNGPFDPGIHCANWWFQGMCLHGAQCRRIVNIPAPSIARRQYHHPAPYYYRNLPWNNGIWCNGDRRYDERESEPVVLTKMKSS